jgi:hypothetical protein
MNTFVINKKRSKTFEIYFLFRTRMMARREFFLNEQNMIELFNAACLLTYTVRTKEDLLLRS